jgi:dihydroflavonol-4-reductase
MIAVTGANGLLGSFMVRKLVAESIPFVALKRQNSDVSLLEDIASKINWRNAEINDPECLAEALIGVSGVIHTAAVVSYHKRDKDKLFKVNVEGTKNVVNACVSVGIHRLLHVSSVAALGRQKEQTFTDESSKWTAGTINSNYAESKYLAELEVWRGLEEGLSIVVVNPSVILAPTDWNKSSAQLFKYAWQERPFYTDGSFSAVDVRDVADSMLRLYLSNIEGQRFILTNKPVTYLGFFQLAAKQFSKKPPSLRVGRGLLQLAAAFEAVRAALTGASPLVTKETAQLAGRHFAYSNEKVKNALGIEFQSVESTISWCCEEYIKKLASKK